MNSQNNLQMFLLWVGWCCFDCCNWNCGWFCWPHWIGVVECIFRIGAKIHLFGWCNGLLNHTIWYALARLHSYLELFGKYNFISCVYSIFVHIQFQWNDGDCSFSWDISHIDTCAGQFDLCRAFATGEVNQKQSLVFFATDIFINQSNNFEFLVCRFAAGYGLFMFFQGNLMFLLGPIVGWIRDITQSYILLVYCLQFFMSLCVFPWLIEIVWLRVKARKSNGWPIILYSLDTY